MAFIFYIFRLKIGINKVIYVSKEAMKPWRILPNIYFLMLNLYLLTILNTCNITEMPPNPIMNDDNIKFVEILFRWILAIKLNPFVNSIIPIIVPSIKSEFKWSVFAINNDKMYSIWVLFNIDIIRLDQSTMMAPQNNICIYIYIKNYRFYIKFCKIFLLAEKEIS